MDLDAYVAEHGAEWRRLEHLTGRRRLDAAEVDELVALYQRSATHLSALRARAPEPALVNRLSHLVLAARARVTGRAPAVLGGGRPVSWPPTCPPPSTRPGPGGAAWPRRSAA
ncbi:hypothetical protein [Micromonospora sp. b486]|uniref:hypothetical protein n=1 Tax=Micromonospora sp. b486 TaxID=3053986 RepID=UPI00259D1237|nr:hypothetical protein [Micromonospora sp. b486]MDM4784570.1 hypothetical protein [Micromonospora sp. b486]